MALYLAYNSKPDTPIWLLIENFRQLKQRENALKQRKSTIYFFKMNHLYYYTYIFPLVNIISVLIFFKNFKIQTIVHKDKNHNC